MAATEFPCTLTIDIPLPTHRLASSALRALQVDAELSPLVRRQFCLTRPPASPEDGLTNGHKHSDDQGLSDEQNTVLRTEYRATTNRMLRVSVNGFMESLGVVLQVMEELDVDVLEPLLPSEVPS
ncbi:uncharacterized protein AB675_7006 [Cyphellophora attinorum]|uniref:Uncharacterized protein n=1 Tax=Cyphellophora attinorum TaxID=1664694 RepID=A0A0N1HEQ6_9EURO|nr:uncharacterized protein AB675_7006 [Phialophora attinorum]KPI43553.1 hypothetical protein AB675_7006 [Phialophora attinorum]